MEKPLYREENYPAWRRVLCDQCLLRRGRGRGCSLPSLPQGALLWETHAVGCLGLLLPPPSDATGFLLNCLSLHLLRHKPLCVTDTWPCDLSCKRLQVAINGEASGKAPHRGLTFGVAGARRCLDVHGHAPATAHGNQYQRTQCICVACLSQGPFY